VLNGPVSEQISDSDPIQSGIPVGRIVPLAGAGAEAAKRTATALNAYLKFCHGVLSDPAKNPSLKKIPANFLLTQRCGKQRAQLPFEKIWGLKGAMIASSAVYAGLAREIGLEFMRATDTQTPGDDLRQRVAQAIADDRHDFIHVHTKVPDKAAHQKDPEHKRDVIALLDRGLEDLAKVMQQRDDILLAITADHSTPSGSSLVHSGEPVPVSISGPNVRRDTVKQFDEIEAARGCLGMLRGSELMAMLLNYANRSVFYSHRLGADPCRYFPPPYAPFRKDDQ
jgi:2,3-bisphosphoglycerate-independent phosphoglycerate mutase